MMGEFKTSKVEMLIVATYFLLVLVLIVILNIDVIKGVL